MDNTIYKAPQSEVETKGSYEGIELWNPDAAGGWSILFTPIFGSFLVRRNWSALGETKKAGAGAIWIGVSIFMALVAAFVPILGLVYLIIWYYSYQKPQTQFVKSKVGTYVKKGWLIPLGIAVACVVALYAVTVALLLIVAT